MRHLPLFLVAIVGLVAPLAAAGTYDWVGPSWSDPTNWDTYPYGHIVAANGSDILTVRHGTVATFGLGSATDGVNSLTISDQAILNHTSGTLQANQVNVLGASTYSMTGGTLLLYPVTEIPGSLNISGGSSYVMGANNTGGTLGLVPCFLVV